MNKNSVYLAIFAVLCVLAGVFMGATVVANTRGSTDKMHRPGFAEKGQFAGGKWQKEGRSSDEFFKSLNLNAEQQAKVKEIMEKTRGEMEKIGKDVRARINEIRQNRSKEIMGILNPEQQEKFKMLQERMEQRFRKNGGKR